MKTRRTATIAGVLMGLAMLAAATPQANAGFVLVWEPNQSTTHTWDYSAFFTTSVDPGTKQPVETLLPTSGSNNDELTPNCLPREAIMMN
jgi:hypothetical protein